MATLLSLPLGAFSCGSADAPSSGPRTLTSADVTNLPPGSAIGETFSGLYAIEMSAATGCNCRVGSCSEWSADQAGSFALMQADGALHLTLHGRYNDSIYDGSINADGTLRVGGGPDSESLRGFSLLTGTVTAQTSLDIQSENTVVGAIGGTEYDCDVSAQISAQYVAPLQ